MEPDDILLLAVLDQVEQREARLLTWGLVDGHVSSSELHGLIDALLDDPETGAGVSFYDASGVIAALIERALLFDIGEEPDSRYRSRMAEGVRLLFRLRQLFPQHRGPTGWQLSPISGSSGGGAAIRGGTSTLALLSHGLRLPQATEPHARRWPR